uniref:DNA repair protein RecO n=1 Tax=uncultured bacterium UPO53 TaxID=1776978 RepID=A0A126SYG5_9BACT|nr:DNA repair protein RecO [uncultured bacterium UPO53]
MLHAYFLHSRPYRETSLLVDLFTAEQGRLAGVWRGARRGKGSAPQLFQPLLLEAGGPGELKTLRQVEAAGPALALAGPALFSAFYLNEILVRLLPREETQTALFVSYADTLGRLAERDDPAALLRRFESGLLDTLGYGIDFGHDSDSGEPVDPAFGYDFHPERGFTRRQAAGALVGGDVLLQLAAGDFSSPAAAQAAKRINRLALARLLGNRPLKSRELFLATNPRQESDT